MKTYDDDVPALAPELIAALGQALTLTPVPAARRLALRERVLAAVQPPATAAAVAMPGLVSVCADDGRWLDLLPGIAIKFLRVDASANVQSSLWRLDAGAVIPVHAHATAEECLVLEGRIDLDGHCYGRGDFLLVNAGDDHGELRAPSGALLYIRCALSESLTDLARRGGLLD